MRITGSVVAASLAAALTACAPEPAFVVPPSPTTTPIFASEEEALAAAEAAYAEYLRVSDEVGQAGWTDVSPLERVASGEALEDSRANAKAFRAEGLRQTGTSAFDSMRLQDFDRVGAGATVVVYLCLDVGGVDVVDGGGRSVVSSDRPERVPLEVNVLFNADVSGTVDRSVVWSGQNFC